MSIKISEEQLERLVTFAEEYRHLAFRKQPGYEYYFMWKELGRDLNYMGPESEYKAAIEWQNIWSQLKTSVKAKVASARRLSKKKEERKTTVYLTELEERIYNVIVHGQPKDPNLRIITKEFSDTPNGCKQTNSTVVNIVNRKRKLNKTLDFIEKQDNNMKIYKVDLVTKQIELTHHQNDETSKQPLTSQFEHNESQSLESDDEHTESDENKENILKYKETILSQIEETNGNQIQATSSQAISSNSQSQAVNKKCACNCLEQAIFKMAESQAEIIKTQQLIISVLQKIDEKVTKNQEK